jgi:hypothetical protein
VTFDDDCPCDNCTTIRGLKAEERRLHGLLAGLHDRSQAEEARLHRLIRELRGDVERWAATANRLSGALDTLKGENEQLRAVLHGIGATAAASTAGGRDLVITVEYPRDPH